MQIDAKRGAHTHRRTQASHPDGYTMTKWHPPNKV